MLRDFTGRRSGSRITTSSPRPLFLSGSGFSLPQRWFDRALNGMRASYPITTRLVEAAWLQVDRHP